MINNSCARSFGRSFGRSVGRSVENLPVKNLLVKKASVNKVLVKNWDNDKDFPMLALHTA